MLAQIVERFNWLCHACSLLDKHYHLSVETIDFTLSRGIVSILTSYYQLCKKKKHTPQINKEKTSYGCRYKYASHGHHLLKDQLPVKSKPISLPYLRL
ncbi:hypothetical protein M1N06_04870 [Peptococcaceae bacterium]|nr:hypothetical protein [Peptococcaceae bacterium]